jgi:hypothetical protein
MFGYRYNNTMRNGLSHCHILCALSFVGRPSSSSARFLWMVSGWRKKQNSVAAPAKAVCSQKMSRHVRKVTMMPPMKGPRAGPISVPLRNHPSAVALSVWKNVNHALKVWRRYLLLKAVAMSHASISLERRLIHTCKAAAWSKLVIVGVINEKWKMNNLPIYIYPQ